MRHLRLASSLLVVVVTLAFGADTVFACTLLPCRMGRFIPEADTLPSNLPAFAWVPVLRPSTEPPASPSDVTLVETDSRRAIALTAEADTQLGYYVLRPTEQLTAGVDYELADSTEIDCGPIEPDGPSVMTTPLRAFRASDAVPLPSSLGTLVAVARGVDHLAVAKSGSCDECIEAERVTVTLEPSAEATPWLPALHFTTWVDGERWAPSKDERGGTYDGGSWFGRGRDLLHHVCRARAEMEHAGLSAGEHVVVMKATLPGTELELATPPVQVRFNCAFEAVESPPACTSDAGVPDPWAAPAVTDDAGVAASPDAAMPTTQDAGTLGQDSSGGGCNLPHGGRSAGGSLALLAAAVMAFVASRRQRRHR